MIAKYKCRICGIEKSVLVRASIAASFETCDVCGGIMERKIPKVSTIYTNDGFTKHIAKDSKDVAGNDS